MRRVRPRLALALAGAGVVLVGGSLGFAGLAAAGDGTTTKPPASTSIRAGLPAAFRAILHGRLARLVAAATITRAQASAIEQRGGADPGDAGALGLTAAQWRAVEDALRASKLQFGGSQPVGPARPKTGTGDGASPDIRGEVDAGLAHLVATGVITRAQAEAVDAQVVSGSVEPAVLAAQAGVTPTQLAAIRGILDAVKRAHGGG